MYRKKFDKESLEEIVKISRDICSEMNYHYTKENIERIKNTVDIVLERYQELVLDEDVVKMLEEILPLVDYDPRAERMAMYLKSF